MALITSDDALLRDVELPRVTTAKHHDANTMSLLQTVPALGKILRLVLLYAIHDIARFPSGQDFVSSCRLVTCAKASAGTRHGTSGTKIGNAHRTWAFSEAAVLLLRDHPAAQKYLARLEKKPQKGQALTLLAQKLARAVSDMRKRKGACDTETFFQRYGRGAEEPEASLDPQGMPRKEALDTAACLASVNAKTPRGHHALRPSL